jgi:preprotein translocase subunit SecG
MSFQLILIVHVFLALGLVVLILMQHGKGANAGAAFGAGASGSVFGARGANSFLYKLTAGIATAFFVTSLTLAYLATNETSSTQNTQSVMSQDEGEATSSDVPMIDAKISDVPE